MEEINKAGINHHPVSPASKSTPPKNTLHLTRQNETPNQIQDIVSINFPQKPGILETMFLEEIPDGTNN